MNRSVKQIAILAAALIAICAILRLTVCGAFTVYFPLRGDPGGEGLTPEFENADLLRHEKTEVRGRYVAVRVRPRQPGRTDLLLVDESGGALAGTPLKVTRFMTVYDEGSGGFTGDYLIMICTTAFFLLVSAIMLHAFLGAKGPAFYAYSTIFFAGFFLFALLTGLMLLVVTARHLCDPVSFSMRGVYSSISAAASRFMLLTLPLILGFAVAMAASNIALLRHESMRFHNVLGILVSVALIAGEAIGISLFSRDFAGSEWEYRLSNTVENVYATCFVYFECILAGAVVCGLKAARHVPSPDRDFIIILGCRFRRDGSLTPLLRGRVDRAIAFWKRQKAETGREARFIPSGGQGPDEIMPEAEAMKRYLLSQGVREDLICVEDQSLNTYQNMAYAKRIMDSVQPGGRAIYVTTNYHVFRSGLWASLAGLSVEGAGSGTKWWYWPNAFMRECVGLLANRLRQELLLLAAMIVFFGALSMLLY